jgi:transposase
MMGLQSAQKALFSYSVDLDERVHTEYPLRKVNDVLDFGFVRERTAEFYGRNGNESVDPAIVMKLMFLLFFDDVVSERELMRMLPYRLDYLWFLGYVERVSPPDS